MTIGLPQALLYYRYGALWQAFFQRLGCRVTVSGVTNRAMMDQGVSHSAGECCLPLKVFLGHAASLAGRCDYVFVPRCERLGKHEEFCVRFWGLPDIVRNTFPGLPVLGLSQLGPALGKSRAELRRAFRYAEQAQREADEAQARQQRDTLAAPGLKVLLAAHPYVAHDPYLGGPLVRMVREQGGVPVFADCCDREACRALSQQISKDLYWTMNKEMLGALPLLRDKIDGVILVSAFPCGTDSLANELLLRRMDYLPMTHVVLDEQQGEAGLHTRVECFMDIIKEKERAHA